MIRVNLAKSLPILGSNNAGEQQLEGLDTDVQEVQKEGAIRLLMICMIPLGLYFYELQNIPTLRAQQISKTNVLASLKAENEKAKGAVDEIKRFREDQTKLQLQIDTLEGLQRERYLEVKILENLQKDIPEKVWLEKIEFKERDLVLEGLAAAGQDLNTFYENLSKSVFLEEVRLVKDSEQSTERGNLRKFEFVCRMDRSIPKTEGVPQ